MTHPSPKRNMIPKAVLMRSSLVSLTTTRPANTAQLRSTVNSTRSMTNVFNKVHSTVRRPINNKTTTKNSNFNQGVNNVKDKNVNTSRPKAVVNTAKPKAVLNVVKENHVNVVKASSCWVWKPKTKVLDHGNPQMDLQYQGVIDNGCSRHITGNMSYLTDFEEIDGGYVAFRGNPKGGKITGRGEHHEDVKAKRSGYAFSDSLLLTPLCCDDIHDVTPRISALAGCGRLVSEHLVIENILAMFFPTRKKSRWGTVFPTGLKHYKEPLVEPEEIGYCDVIVGMDWLSKRKFVMVCHEKVVRITLEGDEIRRVHDERTQGVVKTLMNTKVDELKLSNVSVTKVSYDLVIFRGEHQCCLLRRGAWSSFEVSVGITEEGEVKRRVKLRRVRAMSMTIQSSVKDKILATPSETSKANVVIDALRRKERVKPRRVRAMAMTIQYGERGMILAAQSEAFKQEKTDQVAHFLAIQEFQDVKLARIYIDEIIVRNGILVTIKLRYRWMIYLVVLADAAESVSDTIRFEYFLASLSRWTKSPVIWVEIGGSSLIGPEIVQETTNKVGDRVLLKVTPWKGVVHFGKKADANLHVPLNEIIIDKTLHFVKEPVEIMDCEIGSLKRSKISLIVLLNRLVKSRDEIYLRMGYCDIRDLSGYTFSDSLLLTPLCCDDIYDVTPRVSALAGCDNNVVPPPYARNFFPPKHDLSFSGIEDFVNESIVSEPTVKKLVVETSEAKASGDKPKVVRKNNGAPIIEDWVSDTEEEEEENC
ncbi:hypothetical protein Tco_0407390 [Tanacetum coccineum]